MSQQSLAKTQQVLNLVGQQLPAIFQAANTPGLDLRTFVSGTIFRGGVAIDAHVAEFVAGLCVLMADLPQPAPQVVDDPIAQT